MLCINVNMQIDEIMRQKYLFQLYKFGQAMFKYVLFTFSIFHRYPIIPARE